MNNHDTEHEHDDLRPAGSDWIVGNVGPFQVQAKAFAEESSYGMEQDRRISTLWVALPGTPRTVLYDFDRRDLLKNHLTAEGLAEIVAAVAKTIKPAGSST